MRPFSGFCLLTALLGPFFNHLFINHTSFHLEKVILGCKGLWNVARVSCLVLPQRQIGFVYFRVQPLVNRRLRSAIRAEDGDAISVTGDLRIDGSEKSPLENSGEGLQVDPYEGGVDYKETVEETEKASIDYIDKITLDDSSTMGNESEESTDGYFDWKGISEGSTPGNDKPGLEFTTVPNESQNDVTTTTNVDGEVVDNVEIGDRPITSGSGLDMDFQVENYEIGVTNGRLNEWPVEWVPGEKVFGFFPILIDEYSLNPSPLQIGFEDAIRFRGRHVESTFNSIVDKAGDKEVFGMCFLNPNSGQLAPLAVYAELLSKKSIVDGGGESLEVVGRVLGRVLINRIMLEEPFIKAIIAPMEDKPGLDNPDDIPKIVDEITNLYGLCNELEIQIMELLEHPYAVARIRGRKPLFNIIDERLNKFSVDPKAVNQAFAQIAAYAAFDHHINASDRYDALVMQNSEDRLRFIRDNLKIKIRQMNILKNAPKDSLDEVIKHFKSINYSRESLHKTHAELEEKFTKEGSSYE